MGKMARDKGARGEREVIDLLQIVVNRVYQSAYPNALNIEQITPQLKRTSSTQADGGGCDICGIDWLAIEVKRCETLQLDAWWKQCTEQARPCQMPVLIYRQNGRKWRARCYVQAAVGVLTVVVADLSFDDFSLYFAACLKQSLSRSS
jgi:hypothetical protein